MRWLARFFRNRLITPLINFLKQGVTPHKLALAVALGFGLGIFPVIGSTILLCTIFSFTLRLNLPAIQLINTFVYPLQLIFYIPFFHAGAWIFRNDPIPFSIDEIFVMLSTDPLHTIASLWQANLQAIMAWLLIIPPLMIALYFILLPIFRRVIKDHEI